MLDSAPHIGGIPILINVPAFAIVMFITWLLLRGVRESARANNIMVAVKLVVLALFIVVGTTHINTANYHPFAPNGFKGIHQGAAIVFFAYIGFDAISTAAEETKNPQRNLPIGILGGLAICTVIYIIIGAVLTGMVPSQDLGKAADPLAYALKATGHDRASRRSSRLAPCSRWPRCCSSSSTVSRESSSPWRATVCFRSGRRASAGSRAFRTRRRCSPASFVAVWSLIGDAGETYDLTNIGTLFAFALVCIGVIVLRYTDPDASAPVPRAVRARGRHRRRGAVRIRHERIARLSHGSASAGGS